MSEKPTLQDLIKIDDNTWEIPKSFRSDMHVPARVFVNQPLLEDVFNDRSMGQLVNVATLPGIVQYAMAMPDIHEGYGFPIGGVAACAIEQGGVISPGGIGYDINCGIRLLRANMSYDELKPYMEKLANEIFRAIPSGVGKGGRLDFKIGELDKILEGGAQHMLELGYGNERDIAFCEEEGCMRGARADAISERAKKRGSDQLGTLGSGNHFLEVQKVDEIFDQEVAERYGLKVGQVVIMIHCGSRGLGHQTCTDYVKRFIPKVAEWGITLPDRELVCAPFKTPEAQDYFAAMQAAANYAWANRHMISHWVRKEWKIVLGEHAELDLVYDVSHNMGKVETHQVNGKNTELIVHRKGATRAFGPGRTEMPGIYQSVGQPVLIPGTMGTSSYILAGTQKSMEIAFGTSCHGAGRRMSRSQAKKTVRGSELREELSKQGIIIRSHSDPGLAEEAPTAYKDVEDVVDVVHNAGLAKKVARVVPLAVIKGD